MKEREKVYLRRAAQYSYRNMLKRDGTVFGVAKRRDSVQRPYGMTGWLGGRHALQDDVSPAICPTLQDDSKVAKGGFTLIELLVVVLIIGILAAVAVPQYEKAVLKSRLAGAFAKLEALDKAQTAYYMANGRYTTDLEALDLDLPGVRCSDDEGKGIFCQYFGERDRQNRVLFEFQGHNRHGDKYWICLAKTGEALAQNICQSYYQEWQGTRTPYERSDTGYTYYWGAVR